MFSIEGVNIRITYIKDICYIKNISIKVIYIGSIFNNSISIVKYLKIYL